MVTTEQGAEVEIGVTRFAINPEGESCEFALVIADNMSGKGLGQKLMIALIDVAWSKGLKVMTGEILNDNIRMIKLACLLRFTIVNSPEDSGIKLVSKIL